MKSIYLFISNKIYLMKNSLSVNSLEFERKLKNQRLDLIVSLEYRRKATYRERRRKISVEGIKSNPLESRR